MKELTNLDANSLNAIAGYLRRIEQGNMSDVLLGIQAKITSYLTCDDFLLRIVDKQKGILYVDVDTYTCLPISILSVCDARKIKLIIVRSTDKRLNKFFPD